MKDATTPGPDRRRGDRLDFRRGVSLELKTAAVVAVVLAVLFLAVTAWLHSTWQIGVAVLAAFAVIAAAFDLWVYRPINNLVRRSRKRLGGNYETSDPYYRDELRELGHLVGTLISVFTANEDKEWVSQSIKEDLERLQSLNRQLMDVGQLGKEMNAALPYQETVERVLSRSKSFLHADFAALLLLDGEARSFELGARKACSPPPCPPTAAPTSPIAPCARPSPQGASRASPVTPATCSRTP